MLTWELLIIVAVPGCLTENYCEIPPNLRNAVFNVPAYKVGTILVCDCQKGFRRKSAYANCTVKADHITWDKTCQCRSTSPGRIEHVTQTPKHKEWKSTTKHSPDVTDPPGHCRKPPPWDHEVPQRTFHFVLGQELEYQCAPGFRAHQRQPAKSVCEVHFGKIRWTQPQLTCTREGELDPNPGNETSHPETPGNDNTCPPPTVGVTTGIATPTEPPTFTKKTKEGLFPVEYLITAVVCCVPLMGILLLIGLSCLRRWRKTRRSI